MRSIPPDLSRVARLPYRQYSFYFAAVCMFALGIGATTTIYSVLHATLFPRMPYQYSERMVSLSASDHFAPSLIDYASWREQEGVCDTMAAYTTKSVAWNFENAEPERIRGIACTANMLAMAGVEPFIGQGFHPDDDKPGRSNVVILGYKFWRARYGSNEQILGRSIRIDKSAYTVIGIMGEDKGFPNADVNYWIPWIIDEDPNRYNLMWTAVSVAGRLKSGLSYDKAQSIIGAGQTNTTTIIRNPQSGMKYIIKPFEGSPNSIKPNVVWLLFGAVGLLLVMACINVACLITTRAIARSNEIAVLNALGATRRRLYAQFLLESLMLAVPGGLIGILLAFWGVRLFSALRPADMASPLGIGINLPTLTFSVMLCLSTALIFSFLPLLYTPKLNIMTALKTIGDTPGRLRFMRTRSILLVVQVSLATALLCATALVSKSLYRLMSVDLGFNIENLVTVSVTPSLGERIKNDRRRNSFADDLIRNFRNLPQVQTASASASFALDGSMLMGGTQIDSQVYKTTYYNFVTEDFFRAAGIPILRGRSFDDSSLMVEDNAIVSDFAARAFWPGEEAIGKTIVVRSGYGDPTPLQIIGVCGNARYSTLRTGNLTMVYLPLTKSSTNRSLTFAIRTIGDPRTIIPLIQQAVRTIDPDLPIDALRVKQDMYEPSISRPRYYASIFTIFSLMAVVLTFIGVYGMVHYSVAQRRKEISIRMAMGATRANIRGMVIWQALTVAVIGVAGGLLISALFGNVLKSYLFGVTSLDLSAYVAASIFVVLIIIIASLSPARRATGNDPALLLRSE